MEKQILKGKWIPINILKNTLTVNLQDKHAKMNLNTSSGREYIGNMLLIFTADESESIQITARLLFLTH